MNHGDSSEFHDHYGYPGLSDARKIGSVFCVLGNGSSQPHSVAPDSPNDQGVYACRIESENFWKEKLNNL
jgi:hypothetical protein